MARELPTYTIEGTVFMVDVTKSELRQTDNPANTISFLDMVDLGRSYTFLFDRDKRNLSHPYRPGLSNVVKVTVPQLVELDPVGMADRYGLKVEDLAGKNDFEVIVEPALLAERSNGLLPLVKIAGEEFLYDLKSNQLSSLEHPDTKIKLNEWDISNDGEKYVGCFNLVTKEHVIIDPRATELPRDVVLLEIPNELKLDPWGVAVKNGIAITTFLRMYPLQRDLAANVVPLEMTALAKVIKANRERQQGQFRWPRLIKRRRGRRL